MIRTGPDNPNQLNAVNYDFRVLRMPNLSWRVVRAPLPGVKTSAAAWSNPFTELHVSGDHLDYEPLVVEFQVDEDANNWLEVFDWVVGLTFPRSWDQHKTLAEVPKGSPLGLKSDLELTILTNRKNPRIGVTFEDAFPVQLSGFDLFSDTPDTHYPTATVVFAYTLTRFKRLNGGDSHG